MINYTTNHFSSHLNIQIYCWMKIHTPDPDSSKVAAAVYKKAKLRDLQVAEAGSTFPTHGDDEMR